MSRGLFINPPASQCSIHESGRDIYDVLRLMFDIQYTEQTDPSLLNEDDEGIVLTDYDYIVTNYHFAVNRHITKQALPDVSSGNRATKIFCFSLEMDVNQPLCHGLTEDMFDAFCIPDPTLSIPYREGRKIFSFPRPIVPYVGGKRVEEAIPQIGFHGFATQGKFFDQLVDSVNKEFEEAVLYLHSPAYTHGGQDGPEKLQEAAGKNHPGIQLVFSSDYKSRRGLLNWIHQKDLMIYHYHRSMTGIAATPDQCVAVGTPMSVNGCNTFRHIHPYLGFYPEVSLMEAMEKRAEMITIHEDWSTLAFCNRFSQVLEECL